MGEGVKEEPVPYITKAGSGVGGLSWEWDRDLP